jgi:hypothetical protein
MILRSAVQFRWTPFRNAQRVHGQPVDESVVIAKRLAVYVSTVAYATWGNPERDPSINRLGQTAQVEARTSQAHAGSLKPAHRGDFLEVRTE